MKATSSETLLRTVLAEWLSYRGPPESRDSRLAMFFFLDACTRMSGLSPGKDPGHATQSGTELVASYTRPNSSFEYRLAIGRPSQKKVKATLEILQSGVSAELDIALDRYVSEVLVDKLKTTDMAGIEDVKAVFISEDKMDELGGLHRTQLIEPLNTWEGDVKEMMATIKQSSLDAQMGPSSMMDLDRSELAFPEGLRDF